MPCCKARWLPLGGHLGRFGALQWGALHRVQHRLLERAAQQPSHEYFRGARRQPVAAHRTGAAGPLPSTAGSLTSGAKRTRRLHAYRYVAPDSVVWVATSRGLGRIDGDRFLPGYAGRLPGNVFAVTSRRDGSLWIASDRPGLHRIRTARRTSDHRQCAGFRVGLAGTRGPVRAFVAGEPGGIVDRGRASRPCAPEWAARARRLQRALRRSRARILRAHCIRSRTRDSNLSATMDRRVALQPSSVARFNAEGTLWFISEGKLYRERELVYDLGSHAGVSGQPSPASPPIVRAASGSRRGHRPAPAQARALHHAQSARRTGSSERLSGLRGQRR